MSLEADPRVTALLAQGESGEPMLLELVYDELRGLAQGQMRRERPDHTLQATALVNEACLRLLGTEQKFQSRRHFFGSAVEAMRRVLVDHSRRAKADKRGGDWARVTLGAAEAEVELGPDELLALEEALDALESQDPQAAEVTRLRFYAGLSVQDAAEVLGVTVRTVHRKWVYARARLMELLPSEGSSDGSEPKPSNSSPR